MVIRLSNLAGRENFSRMLNRHKLTGIAVEVGTHQGRFAANFLRHWEGSKLYCIDPWVSGYDDTDPASHGDRDIDYKLAVKRLQPYRKKVAIMKTTSDIGVKKFRKRTLDFIYIDACHQSASVKRDLSIWWPKLKIGGILAGHDIVSGVAPGHGWDRLVRPVVNRFAQLHKTPLLLVPELPGKNWSYYLVKKRA